ncbi:MAG: helix-turn-helix domain-containing protein [Opitutaceae bacterium]
MPTFDLSKYTLKEPEINIRVGVFISQLMDQHKILGKTLAENTGLREQTITRLRKGSHRTTRKNLERIKDALCSNEHERARLQDLYEGKGLFLSDTVGLTPLKTDLETRLLAETHLSERAVDIHRRIAVREAIEAVHMEYIQDYAIGPIHVDFLVTIHFPENDAELGFDVPVERQLGIFLAGEDTPELFEAIACCLREYLMLDEVIFILAPKKRETRRGPKPKEPKRLWHKVVSLEQLRLDLMHYERLSCPPPRSFSHEDIARINHLKGGIKTELKKMKVKTATKDGHLCAVRNDKKLIAIIPSDNDQLDIDAEIFVAEQIQQKMKCESVVIVIPDEWGTQSIEMQNGVKVLALSQLTVVSLGV